MQRKKKQTIEIGGELSKPLPDIREVIQKIKAIQNEYRKRAGMGKDEIMPSFDQLKRMKDDSWVVVLRCDTMINKLRLAMLQEAEKSKDNPGQWNKDIRTANDFILESE